MSKYGLKSLDLDVALTELPGNIFQELCKQLDNNPEDKDWRALVRAVEDKYELRPVKVERWSPAFGIRSAADKLLTDLSSQGMTVRELRVYLDQIQVDTYTLGLSEYEDVRIQKQPPESVETYEGDPLVLEVEATGKPYPRYQWFFCKNGQETFEALQGRTEKKLLLNSVTGDNAGTYCCRVNNCGDGKKTKFSNKILVSVAPNPNPTPNGLNPPLEESIIQHLRQQYLDRPPVIRENSVPGAQILLTRACGQGLIIGHPTDVEVSMNEPFLLSVETSGTPPITYQWYRNNVRLEGQVTPKLNVRHAMPADFGRYHCVVSNGIKTEHSNVATVKQKLEVLNKNAEIVIVTHPRSVTVKIGGGAIFSCEARCSLPLKYQWFKGGSILKGQTESEIQFRNIQDRLPEGWYQCEISVDCVGGPRILTDQAFLKVDLPHVNDNVVYNPSDKVALLIGNSDYKCETRLNAATKDVRDLKDAFTALDFRVVSLLNLTKPEIENAVLSFCELVGENIYVVVYLCGHGFEEHGHTYLVPTDAPHGYSAQDCVCSETVLENIQRKNPALVMMIMDICRQPGKVKSNGPPDNMKVTAKGNTVYCYATSTGLGAYENKNGGLLVHHLSQLLKREVGIDVLISQMKEEFHRVHKHSSIQIPELRSNLLQPRRSLQDKISRKGQTESFQQRCNYWTRWHVKPPKQTVRFPKVGVVVELDFQAEFSNVLNVFVTVLDPGITRNCIGKITNMTPPVSLWGEIAEISQITTKITLQDIQKLKDDLIVDVTIIFEHQGKSFFDVVRKNLGQPLVAKFQLWKPRDNFMPNAREAVEQTEDSSLT